MYVSQTDKVRLHSANYSRKDYMMPKKPMPRSYAGQPQATPMPTRATAQDALSTNPQRPPSEVMKVDPMNDYPNGRGGMQMAPMVPAEKAKTSMQPGVPIGPKPSATKMPTTS